MFNTVKNNIQLRTKVLYFLHKGLLVLLLLVAILMGLSTINLSGNARLYTVQSGSMEPSIDKGALIIIRALESYQVGDVINVSESSNSGVSVTHRIVGIENIENQVHYITKGDANQDVDSEKRREEDVLGKVIFDVPFIGYLIDFIKTREGLIVFILIPSVLIILHEMRNIGREAKKLRESRKEKRLSNSKGKVVRFIIVILATLSIVTMRTMAYMVQRETSGNNTFSAGKWDVLNSSIVKTQTNGTEMALSISITPTQDPTPIPTLKAFDEVPLPTIEAISTPIPSVYVSPITDLSLETESSLGN